jgi:hypothetical protein
MPSATRCRHPVLPYASLAICNQNDPFCVPDIRFRVYKSIMRLLPLLLLFGLAAAGQDAFAWQTTSTPAGAPPVTTDPARSCETAVTTAEFIGRLPARMLAAISQTESGRIDAHSGVLRPWPWTINAEGVGQFFATKQDVIAAAMRLQARGVQSIDVGCMQINLMHHPHAFVSLSEAFDPHSNALYAARFLNSLYAGGRDWPSAIAAYHSETPAFGGAYRDLVLAHWQNSRWQNFAGGDTDQRSVSYRDFVPSAQIYGAFAPRTRVYGGFATSPSNRAIGQAGAAGRPPSVYTDAESVNR